MSGWFPLTFNPGSSTVKLGLFVIGQGAPRRHGHRLNRPAARPSVAPHCRRIRKHQCPDDAIADRANQGNALRIDAGGKVAVLVRASDEERIIAEEARTVLNTGACV